MTKAKMRRREFLTSAGRLALILPASALLTRCGGGGGNGARIGDFTVMSTTDAGHNHSVVIRGADLENPPSAGVTYATSSSDGHTHTVALSEAQLEQIASRETIPVTSSTAILHTHQFVISRPA